ncbi:hypothetical protein LWI28_016383 [Acer negundo]|uniref:FBD domain-containing protein n=1 Tax=Acer negundo TaxID=4023 RepID=A0AAD5IQE5_ACENE|nr:hypothetical protein LWI28_016383 [Acer negundo]
MWDINTKIGERPNESEIEEKRSKYINWVDKVLELHRGRYINEFRIHFDLGDNQKSYITNWIHTALAKGVQKLELNFDRFVGIIWKEYRFPVECYNTLKSPHGLSIIKSLRYDVQLRNLIDPIIPYLPRLETLELLLNLKKLICDAGNRKLHQFPNCSLEHVKEVEFIGFVGYPIDLELAFYFLENAPMLKKMIVNPTNPYLMGSYFEFENSKSKQAARKRVKPLKRRVPQWVELVVC